jgi:hypothetical protein
MESSEFDDHSNGEFRQCLIAAYTLEPCGTVATFPLKIPFYTECLCFIWISMKSILCSNIFGFGRLRHPTWHGFDGLITVAMQMFR